MKIFFTIIIGLSIHLGYSQCLETVYKGEGTFYGYTGGGNCSFPHPYSALYSAALNAPQYGNSQLCGACAEVTGPKGSITVSIEDQCPECKLGDLDFAQNAFPFIADPIAGRVPISWKIVPCPVKGSLSFQFKEGSSQYWAGIQVRNHRFPISKFEYKNDKNVYVTLPRENYNYFTAASGMGPGPYDFRVTDILGQVLEIGKIPLTETETVSDKQFAPCSITTTQDEMLDLKVQVYPNPSAESTRYIANHETFALNFELYDILGRIIKSSSMPAKSELKLELPSNGTYILKFSDQQGKVFYEKLVR